MGKLIPKAKAHLKWNLFGGSRYYFCAKCKKRKPFFDGVCKECGYDLGSRPPAPPLKCRCGKVALWKVGAIGACKDHKEKVVSWRKQAADGLNQRSAAAWNGPAKVKSDDRALTKRQLGRKSSLTAQGLRTERR